MVTTDDRAARVIESRRKYTPPFVLDESLCLYSPQDNVDALAHPRVADWIDFTSHRYRPRLPKGQRILLLLPCTATKPYIHSTEHRRINQALLEAGFAPAGRGNADPLLNQAPLVHLSGLVLHRAVISEPLGLVPYEHMLEYEGRESPAVAYDDPGLFENRGNAVSPWRADHSATRVGPHEWKWGPNEKRAYVAMHNAMAAAVAAALQRFGHLYDRRIAWVAPGLTHRSFVVGQRERAAHGVPAHRLVAGERLALTGVNDLLPPELAIECLPTRADCDAALLRLAARMGLTPRQAAGPFGRGGGGATPLALPELLETLLATLMRRTP